MTYDTFICYRGNSVDGGIGIKLGQRIYQMIGKDHPVFGRTFFAPCYPSYDFMKEGRQIVESVKYFIVILSPNFFSDFEEDGVIDEESSTYLELHTALRSAECRILPIFAYGFDWQQRGAHYKDTLKRLYPDCEVGKLMHQAGVRVENQEITQQQLDNLIPAGTVKRKNISKDEICRELQRCGDTIALKIWTPRFVPDYLDYIEARSGGDRDTQYLAARFSREFENMKAQCGLPGELEAPFCAWPVDLDQQEGKEYERLLSICAICFGIMSLHNWIYRDSGRCVRDERRMKTYREMLKKKLDGAINLLIAMRSPNYGSWPSSWNFSDQLVVGTINQTTLSISTLMTCGFLPEGTEEETSVAADKIQCRFEYLCKSIDWLLEAKNTARNTYGEELIGWGHMAHSGELMLLPTTFVFDTLLKFERMLHQWMPYFLQQDPQFALQMEAKLRQLQQVRKGVVLFFEDIQQDDGSFKQQEEKPFASISHTAKVHKSLQSMLSIDLFDDEEDCMQCAGWILEKTTEFLKSCDTERVMNLREDELFEHFTYIKGKPGQSVLEQKFLDEVGENFEICGELIYADALVKSAEEWKDKDPQKAKELFEKAVEVFTDFQGANVSSAGDRCRRVKSHRPEVLSAPIYTLYYYRMVLADMLSYLTKGECGEC